MLKRVMDLFIAGVALSVAWPIMVGLVVLIRLDSCGPAVFRQKRVGQRGRTFTFYKFRTMWVDARQRYPDLYTYQYTEGQIRDLHFQVRDDPRLTRVGRWLRKTSLDELPNLWNVLRGEMSLVGPRPQIPEMLPYYSNEHHSRFSVKPGVVGLAQVSGRGLLTFQETVAADLETCRRYSLWFDTLILARMLRSVALRVGAF